VARHRHDLVVVGAALDDHVDLDRPEPARSAASIPRSTSATGKSASFMRLKIASSIASRLTVTRWSPAAFSAAALRSSSDPFVVSVSSSGEPSTHVSSASIATRRSTSRRSSGSPPVRRTLRTPWATKRRATRTISSNVSSEECGRNA
jgi:hypothetical protein